MHNVTTVELTRDCEAVQIPVGNTVMLPAGTSVDITQTLGGTFTVHAMGGLFRITSKDADALGVDPAASGVPKPASAGPVDEKAVWEVLKTCYDPEIPVNIVELGLVYTVELGRRDDGERKVDVRMTLTAPACGMGDILVDDVRSKVERIPTVAEADVELVFDPPWNQSMMSEAAKLETGML